jgi:preprotein translocase subunit SecG
MFTFLAVVYVIVCIFLILVVLLQAGKGGGMGAAFGGGASQTVFGATGAGNFLTRLTWISAVLFMVLSGSLAYLSSSSDKVLEEAERLQRERDSARNVEAAPTKAPAAAGMSSPENGDGSGAAAPSGGGAEPAPAASPAGGADSAVGSGSEGAAPAPAPEGAQAPEGATNGEPGAAD